jgi:hypothetical protein
VPIVGTAAAEESTAQIPFPIESLDSAIAGIFAAL